MLRKRPWVTGALVAINVVIFLAFNALEFSHPDDVEKLTRGLVFDPRNPSLLTSLTSMFMHAGWLHLVGNMVVLWVMGAGVENRLGHVGFLAFYLLGGAGSDLAHMWTSDVPVLGASGAISAVTGAYLVFFPLARVRVLFITLSTVEVPAWWFVIIGVIWNFYFAANGGGGNIAFVAHLGGYGAGIALSIALIATGVVERHDYDGFAVVSRIHRRRRFHSEVAQVRDEQARAALNGKPLKAGLALSDKDASALAEARAAIAVAVNEQRMGDAATSYTRLVRTFPTAGKATTLSARVQIAIANHLMQTGSHADAATAYQAYAEAYPDDRETPGVRVLLAAIALRHLKDRERARAALEGIEPRLADEHQRRLASDLRAELGKT